MWTFVESPGSFSRFRSHAGAKARADNRFHPQVGSVSLVDNPIVAVLESLDQNLATLVSRALGRRGQFSTGRNVGFALKKAAVTRSRRWASTDMILRLAIFVRAAHPCLIRTRALNPDEPEFNDVLSSRLKQSTVRRNDLWRAASHLLPTRCGRSPNSVRAEAMMIRGGRNPEI